MHAAIQKPLHGQVLQALPVNIVLVLLLAFRFKGSGIAFALSFSSAVNTVLLVRALRKRNTQGIAKELRTSLIYAGKMLLFSAIAIVPAIIVDKAIFAKVADAHSRLVAAGLPLLSSTITFAAIGIGLLVLTKDPVAASITKAFSHRTQGRTVS